MIYLKPELLLKLRSSIAHGLESQKTVLETTLINLAEDDAEIDVDNCFVATEEEIAEWIEKQESSGGFTDAERADLRASYIENYPELYPDVGAKYIVTTELSDGQESVFALSLQVNHGQGGMSVSEFYGFHASRDDAMAAGKALEGIVFI